MIASIHQPHYLPWLRYFEKVARSDVFILLDDVQYEKNGFQNRNKIKTAQGWSYLTVPVRKPTLRPIREIEVDGGSWRQAHRRALEINYGKAPYFHRYWPELAALYEREWSYLAELCRAMLDLFLRQIGIEVRVVASSANPTSGQSTRRLAELCRAAGADVYLSGANAAGAYLDPELMRAEGIEVVLQEWRAPTYAQLYPGAGFVPDLAIVDLLWNEGPRTREILLASGGVSRLRPPGAV